MRGAVSKQVRHFRILSVLMGLTLLFIWGHSMVPAKLSSEESSRFVVFFNGLISDVGGSFFVTDHMVRKTAHFIEYAVLGAETALRTKWKNAISPGRSGKCPDALFFWVGVPVTDELIQYFTPGRACMIQDVILDMSGFAAGYGSMQIISSLAGKNNRFK